MAAGPASGNCNGGTSNRAESSRRVIIRQTQGHRKSAEADNIALPQERAPASFILLQLFYYSYGAASRTTFPGAPQNLKGQKAYLTLGRSAACRDLRLASSGLVLMFRMRSQASGCRI